jgi:ribosomal protein S12 methylthiotransferase accessory factor
MAQALAKVILDLGALTQGFRPSKPLPESWDDYSQVMHGATYMAQHDRRQAFDFLLASPAVRKLSDIMRMELHDEPLKRVLRILKSRRMPCYVVELSPDEAIRSGIRVVRAIIPGLQPLSFRYRAKFLGHPRLYDAPRRMGFPSLPEEDLNEFPQPFA